MRVLDSVDPHISHNNSFLEMEAAAAAGLDLWQWENGEYPKWFRVRIVAWYNMHNLVELHRQDAVARHMRRKRPKG